MKPQRVQRRRRMICALCLALIGLALFPASLGSQKAKSSEMSGHPDPAQPPVSSGKSVGTVIPQLAGHLPAPPDPPFPFSRLVAVFCSGLMISGARLANKFRRFWGLGVFTNIFAVLFLLIGAGVSSVPALLEHQLSTNKYIGTNAAPWVASLSGIVLVLILPGVRLKSNERRAGEGQIRDFEDALSPNPVLSFLENQIRSSLMRRIQVEFTDASQRFDMTTIKLAARRALADEMIMWPLAREDYEAARETIEKLRAVKDARVDSNNRYLALKELLRWCSFKALISGLDAVASEVQP